MGNLTGQGIIVGPRDPDPGEPPERVDPGHMTASYPGISVCETKAYVATTLYGELLAEIPSGCQGYTWSIYGLNNFTYTKD